MIALQVCDEVKDKLKDSRIIEIVGAVKTGKTTLACNIAKLKGRETIVLSPHIPDCDMELYSNNGMEVIEAKHRYRDRLSKLKGGTIIFDDAQALSRYQKDCLNGMLINLRKEKQDLHVIIVYHYGSAIHNDVLRNNISFLIVKRNSNISTRKIGIYLNIKGRNTAVKEMCDNLTEFESLYLFKESYGTIDSNEIYEILHKEREGYEFKYDYDSIVERLKNGDAVKDIVKYYKEQNINIHPKTIYKYMEIAKRRDSEFSTIRQGRKECRVRDSPSERGYRTNGLFTITKQIDTLNTGRSRGYKRENVIKFQRNEDIGDLATETIADVIIENMWKRFKDKPIGYCNIITDTSKKGGCDITIDTPSKTIEIEVKNWSVNPNRRYIYPCNVVGNKKKNGIKDKFSDNSDKWLFACGLNCSKDAKVFLDMYGIKYLRLTNKQLKNPNPSQRYRIKRRIDKWITNVI